MFSLKSHHKESKHSQHKPTSPVHGKKTKSDRKQGLAVNTAEGTVSPQPPTRCRASAHQFLQDWTWSYTHVSKHTRVQHCATEHVKSNFVSVLISGACCSHCCCCCC